MTWRRLPTARVMVDVHRLDHRSSGDTCGPRGLMRAVPVSCTFSRQRMKKAQLAAVVGLIQDMED